MIVVVVLSRVEAEAWMERRLGLTHLKLNLRSGRYSSSARPIPTVTTSFSRSGTAAAVSGYAHAAAGLPVHWAEEWDAMPVRRAAWDWQWLTGSWTGILRARAVHESRVVMT